MVLQRCRRTTMTRTEQELVAARERPKGSHVLNLIAERQRRSAVIAGFVLLGLGACTELEGRICGNLVCRYGCDAKGTGCLARLTCGNGIVESGEECDDGNLNSWDGCSDDCQNEVLLCVPGDYYCKDTALARCDVDGTKYTWLGHTGCWNSHSIVSCRPTQVSPSNPSLTEADCLKGCIATPSEEYCMDCVVDLDCQPGAHCCGGRCTQGDCTVPSCIANQYFCDGELQKHCETDGRTVTLLGPSVCVGSDLQSCDSGTLRSEPCQTCVTINGTQYCQGLCVAGATGALCVECAKDDDCKSSTSSAMRCVENMCMEWHGPAVEN